MYPSYNHNWRNISTIYIYKTRLASNEIFSPSNKTRNISTIYIYKTRLASNEIFSPSNKTHREVGRAKDISVPLSYLREDCLAPEDCTDILFRNVI